MLENGMKINLGKSKAVSFMSAWVKDPLNYSLLDEVIQEASSCKYLGIILFSDLSWSDHVNYPAKKAWKAFHFIMHILKNELIIQKFICTSLLRPILEYGAACWDPFREGQIIALDWVQKKQQNLQILQTMLNGKRWHIVEK